MFTLNNSGEKGHHSIMHYYINYNTSELPAPRLCHVPHPSWTLITAPCTCDLTCSHCLRPQRQIRSSWFTNIDEYRDGTTAADDLISCRSCLNWIWCMCTDRGPSLSCRRGQHYYWSGSALLWMHIEQLDWWATGRVFLIIVEGVESSSFQMNNLWL